MVRSRVLAVAVLSASAITAAPAGAAELPDLEQVPPYKFRVEQRGGHWYLGFATAVRNAGAAALRIRGNGSGNGAMLADQLSEDGSAVIAPAVGLLRFVSTEGHHHWHFMGFMRYELRGVDRPSVLRDRKQGFCLAQAPFTDGWCARDKPGITTTDEGIAPGNVDVYEPNVEGQEIRIDPQNTPSGRYALTSRIGPTGAIHETRTDNNAASTVVELRWPMASGQEIASLGSCVGEGCVGALPPPPRRHAMSARTARRLARRALRRVFGRLPRSNRVSCKRSKRGGRLCRVGFARRRATYSGRVRVWYVIDGAATRWYFTLGVDRSRPGCHGAGCTHRVRRVGRRGGTLSG